MSSASRESVTVDPLMVEYGRRLFEAMGDLAATMEEHREDLPEAVSRALDRLLTVAEHRPR